MNPGFGGRAMSLVLAFFLLLAAPARAHTDAERLEKRERAVQLLQQRNTELEQEVRGLKQQRSTPAVAAVIEAPPKLADDAKAVVEKPAGDVLRQGRRAAAS